MIKIRQRLLPIFAIAKNTQIELCQEPLIMLLTLTGFILIALIPLFTFHTFGEPGRLCRDGALAYQLVIGAILASSAASSSIEREIKNGTALSLMSKPISRNIFIIGKHLGILLTIIRFWGCTLAAAIISWRVPARPTEVEDGIINLTDPTAQSLLILIPILSLLISGYLHNKKHIRFCYSSLKLMGLFSITALILTSLHTRTWNLAIASDNLDYKAVNASLLILFILTIYSAIATMLSTRIGGQIVLLICLILIFIGLSADYISSISPVFNYIPLPNLQSFWMADFVTPDSSIGVNYIVMAFLYTLCANIAFISIGNIMLSRRDIQ